MPATRIRLPAPGEDLVGIDPALLQNVDEGWRRRLNLFTGRALTATALASEQQYREGLLAALGTAVTPGIVDGLVFSANGDADPLLSVTPGYGISARGDDASVFQTLQTRLSTLAVIDAASNAPLTDPKTLQPATFGAYAAQSLGAPAGVFALQPIVAQVTGAFDDASTPLEVTGTLDASCDVDPSEYAFEDIQTVEGVRLVFVPWPAADAALVLPAAAPAATYRNRVVYAVFAREAQLGFDEALPWTAAGVPLALAAFAFPSLVPAFVDRAAVVRPGGLPRRRVVVPGVDAVQPALAQARIAQLGEHVADAVAANSAFAALGDVAALLPPAGVLPARAVDFMTSRNVWFPHQWTVSAGPVHLEELETALEAGMLGAPLDTTANETIEVLVPLADALYDPNVLVTETVAPDFRAELDAATARRDEDLQRRKTLQLQLNVLQTVLGPNAPSNPNAIDIGADVTADERTGRDALPAFWPLPGATPDLTFGTRIPATRQPSTAYAVGQIAFDPSGNAQRVQSAGTSGAGDVAWNATPGGTTADGTVTWFNAGSTQWSPATAYVVNQFAIDPNGYVQTVEHAGTSGASAFIWNAATGAVTPEGTMRWANAGPRGWQAQFAYGAGQAVVDDNGNVQAVLNPGRSGTTQPAWGDALDETTTDGAVTWECLGPPTVWAPDTAYETGSTFVDPAGNVQRAQNAGVSGDTQTIWNSRRDGTTNDGGVVWRNDGGGTWLAATAFAPGQFAIDPSGNLQTVIGGGTSGSAAPAWSTTSGATTQDGGVTWIAQTWTSVDLTSLEATAAAAPYTLTWPAWQPSTAYAAGQIVADPHGNLQSATTAGTSAAAPPAWKTAPGTTTDGTVTWTLLSGRSATISLIGDDDWNDLAQYGLQHFVDRLNAKVKRANDLIDLAFLTTQTDIYRFRQNVLGATDATRLAVSPILANIATGITAAATAENIKDYFTSISQPVSAPSTSSAPAAATTAATTAKAATSATATSLFTASSITAMRPLVRTTTPFTAVLSTETFTASTAARQQTAVAAAPAAHPAIATQTFVRPVETAVLAPHIIVPAGGVQAAPTVTEVQAQSPLVGAQLDIRTLSVAERLAQPPSQESLFYAVGNRVGLMQLLADLELTVDDIPIMVDADAPAGAPPPNEPIPTELHTVLELRETAISGAVFDKLQNPIVRADSDEATVFSTGVRVLEQHTQLLRALEARVQTYVDFVNVATTALGNVQNDVASAQTALRGAQNDLSGARADVAFTSALFTDEQQRVAGVNAQRRDVLQSAVAVVAYARPRTLDTDDDVPSRQLVPGAVANPVPMCLHDPVAVPPELREIVALLREAPTSWLPSVRAAVATLDGRTLLQDLALGTQARAAVALQLPIWPSSALLSPSTYGPTIAQVYQTNQSVIRRYQVERSQFVPATVATLSWQAAADTVSRITTIADLAASSAVHAETVNAVANAQQQIAAVAGCLYARANAALPVDRLAWADFLRGPGLAIDLSSLAVLPQWNTQPYADRQGMQMLVDWLFAQVDGAEPDAVAYISDVVRTCILLASHAPVDDVIAGALAVRTQASVGTVISLPLASPRIVSGMYVQLYAQGNLAAEAVVSDFDDTTVSATVTTVHVPGVTFQPADVVHFTTQAPVAAALRAFAL